MQQREALFVRHLARYGHIPAWFDNEPWTITDLHQRAQLFAESDAVRKRLAVLGSEMERRARKREQIMAELNPPAESKNLIETIQRFAFLRQEGEVQIGYHNVKGDRLKQLICRELGIGMSELRFLTDEEIVRYLEEKRGADAGAIAERRRYCFAVLADGHATVYTGSRAKLEADKIKSQIREPVRKETLTGLVGSPGYAKGPVRILRSLADIPTIKPGEIMVVSGTSVEYIVAMETAAGIVAEFGGITGHAAVIARELQKPCLTQVENATALLTDGEIVELDARGGVLRRSVQPWPGGRKV